MQNLAESLDPPVPEEEVKAAETTQEAPEAPEKAVETPEAQDTTQEAEKPKKTVPLEALHEERQRRKELQQQLQRNEFENAQRFQMLAQRLEALQQAANPPPKVPDYNDDPIGSIKAGVDLTQQQIQELREHQSRQNQEFQAREYASRVERAVANAEAQVAASNPDYYEAVAHLKSARQAQLEALGYSEEQAAQYVANEAFSVAETSLRNGRNPAEAVLQMARASGWTPKPKAQEQKMDTLQKGVQASKSLGSGGNPPNKLSLEALADMPDDEFAEVMKSGKWKQLGGA